MKNAMQLKALIKNLAQDKSISSQLVMQNYMLERLLERITLSSYRNNFILKGGFLIASFVGLSARTTMDLDTTIKGLDLSEQNIRNIFETILKVRVDDGISFSIRSIREIRPDDEYAGFRVSLSAVFPPMVVPVKVDITTGDIITPKEIAYSFKMMFEDRSISAFTYTLETVLAEKLETIISRGDQNTRPRDFYDVFILTKLQKRNIHIDTLKTALFATAQKRNSVNILANYSEILSVISSSTDMNKHWLHYQKEFEYAKGVCFNDVCEAVRQTLDTIYI